MEYGNLSDTEKFVARSLENSWENVFRCTETLNEKLKRSDIGRRTLKNIEEHKENMNPVFVPGVPDFLAASQSEYLFVEAKGEGDGLRHSQLKWLADNKNLETEIWFTDDNQSVRQKLSSDRVSSYTFSQKKSSESSCEVLRKGKTFYVEVPRSLAAMLGIDEESKVSWSALNGYDAKMETR